MVFAINLSKEGVKSVSHSYEFPWNNQEQQLDRYSKDVRLTQSKVRNKQTDEQARV